MRKIAQIAISFDRGCPHIYCACVCDDGSAFELIDAKWCLLPDVPQDSIANLRTQRDIPQEEGKGEGIGELGSKISDLIGDMDTVVRITKNGIYFNVDPHEEIQMGTNPNYKSCDPDSGVTDNPPFEVKNIVKPKYDPNVQMGDDGILHGVTEKL